MAWLAAPGSANVGLQLDLHRGNALMYRVFCATVHEKDAILNKNAPAFYPLLQ